MSMRRAGLLLLIVLSSSGPGRVDAQASSPPPVAKTGVSPAPALRGGASPAKPAAKSLPAKKLEPIETLRAALASGDAARAGAALDALGARSDGAAVAALRDFLVVGQADAWADRAIEALGNTRSPDARALLAELAQHRRVSARVLAYRGLAAIPGEQSDALLAQGLRDSDPGVRGLCATQLGERDARPMVDLLLRALERGVPEAAAAIGKLGDADAVARYGALLQRLPIAVMLSGYGEFLRRRDLPEATKLEIVARLGEVAGVVVKGFLEQLVADGVGKGSGSFELALRETAKRIDAGGGK
jgi:HEAT repeat protein